MEPRNRFRLDWTSIVLGLANAFLWHKIQYSENEYFAIETLNVGRDFNFFICFLLLHDISRRGWRKYFRIYGKIWNYQKEILHKLRTVIWTESWQLPTMWEVSLNKIWETSPVKSRDNNTTLLLIKSQMMLLTMEDDEPWPKISLVGVTYCVMLYMYTDNYWLEYIDKREESTLLCDRGRAPNYISCKCIQ